MGQKEDEICPQYVVKSVSFESRPLGVRKESRKLDPVFVECSLIKSAWSRVLELYQIFSEGECWLKRRFRGESKRENTILNYLPVTHIVDCDSSALEDRSGYGFMKWIKEKFPHCLFLYSSPLFKSS